MTAKIAPSILSADFGQLAAEVDHLARAGADYIHLDVMDGHFVPNITIGPPVVAAIRKATTLPLDVHLMIDAPDLYIDAFADAGADLLTVHPEACRHLQRTLQMIRQRGMQAGVALNPASPLCLLDHILDDLDMILVMTVNPGFGGQAYIPAMTDKVACLRQQLDAAGYAVPIEVDGGITVDTIADVSRAGASVFVSGSGILKTADYQATISRMRALTG